MADEKITYAKAIRQAIVEEMHRDENIIVMGQDIRQSVWGVTTGIDNDFDMSRIYPLPISENGFCGVATGAAMTGLRPVVEFMYGDFLLLAMDAICNQAAKYRYMCGGGEFKIPVVFRVSGTGIGSGSGQHHAQYPESWVMHFPGLKIVTPSTANDAYGLMKTAIRDNNPVLFFEYKQLFGKFGTLESTEPIPFGKAKITKEGSDVTIVTYGTAAPKSLAAAQKLETEGIHAEVIDLRTIKPLDKECILKSVEKTNKLIIVEDSIKTGGVGAEIAAIAAEEAVGYLDGAILRVAGKDTSMPAGKMLEIQVVPSENDIIKAVKSLL